MMDLQPVSITQTVPYFKLMTAQYGPDKITVPVNRNEYIYARFEHVKGVKPVRGDGGVPLIRLRVLNSLINQLGKINDEVKGLDASSFKSSELNSFLHKYEDQIHRLAQKSPKPYGPTFFEPGLLFDTLL